MLSRDEIDSIAIRTLSMLNDAVSGRAVNVPLVGAVDPRCMWPALVGLLSMRHEGQSSAPSRGMIDMQPQELAQYVISYAEAIIANDDNKWSFRALALASGSCADIFFTLKRAARGEQEYRYDTVFRLVTLMRERFPDLDPLMSSEG